MPAVPTPALRGSRSVLRRGPGTGSDWQRTVRGGTTCPCVALGPDAQTAHSLARDRIHVQSQTPGLSRAGRTANLATPAEAKLSKGEEPLRWGPQEGGRSALPPTGKTDVGLMKGRLRGAGLAGESGGVAGRSKLAGASGPSHGEGRRDVGKKKAPGRGAGRGRAVWPEGPELKLNTRLWRDRPPFSSAPSIPLPFPLPPFS